MKKLYYSSVLILSLISILLALLDISNVISVSSPPYGYLDKGILVFFWIDYITRFVLAKNKKQFFKSNIFDLLAIIPFDSIFYFFRAFRVLRVIKLLRLIRIVGFTGKIQKSIKRFFGTNGFIYLVITTVVLIMIGAEVYSVAESVDYMNSLWWAIATMTTVGYGDISPHTEVGRFVAVTLMILGIGLIGSVTSTVTAFFVDEKSDKENNQLKQELQDIKLELQLLHDEIKKGNE
ncbi:ion transporter [Leuconostoc gasicomitatum]|uniref:ion transporter n=1 Tax=Leuconostoc gasicomitatum TaxID=115778 RepID=UPI000B7CB89B|nr:potassium channel family protein [Leuconostoc gasicomitatum]